MTKTTLTLLLLLACTAAQAQKNFIDQPFLEVTGSADSMVTPDEIYIRIYITEKNSKDKISLEDQEASMYKSLKAIGINVEKELRVHDMASTFKTYLLKSSSVVKSREYILKVTDASTAGKVFVELEKIDISNSNIIAVNHSAMENIRNRLRSKAVEDAKVRAIALTKPLNQSVGPAIHLEEKEAYNTASVSNYAGNMRRRGSETVTQMDGIVVDGPIDIDFTKITVSASIALHLF